VQAYDLYLRGLSLWQQRTETSLFSAIDDFKKAIARDPKFAQAYAGLALAYAVIPEYSVRIGFSEALEQCRLAAEHALALDPGSADAYAALGNVESAYNRQLELGIAMLDRAIALQPSFATAYQWRGQVLANIGQFNEGLQSLQRARELDPRSLVVAYALAYTYYQMGRYDEAIAACKPVLSYAPDNVLCPETMGMVYLAQGKNDLARSYFERWSKLRGGAGARDIADLFDVLQGHAGRKALVRRLASTPVRAWYQKGSGYLFTDYEIPVLLVRLGDKDAALRFLAADASRFIGFDAILADPHLDTIRCDPRFKAIMSTRGWHDGRAAKLCGRGAPVHTGNTP
jgi:tetratricopeptide (TPR) repeat protein